MTSKYIVTRRADGAFLAKGYRRTFTETSTRCTYGMIRSEDPQLHLKWNRFYENAKEFDSFLEAKRSASRVIIHPLYVAHKKFVKGVKYVGPKYKYQFPEGLHIIQLK